MVFGELVFGDSSSLFNQQKRRGQWKSKSVQNLNSSGDQVITIGSESKELTDLEVDGLMEALRTGKEDSKIVKAALKTITSIRKQYNTVGKPVATLEGVPNEAA